MISLHHFGALLRGKRSVRNLLKDNQGVTAVEFALIGPIFFSLMFSSLELGFVLAKEALLDSAASEISRTIYTGSVTSGVVTQDQLKDAVCEKISIIYSDCKDNLSIELTTITDFTSLPDTDAICHDSDEPIKPAVTFNPGASNNIVFMRICLTTNVYTPGMGLGLSFPKTSTGKLQLVSALAFSNEPF